MPRDLETLLKNRFGLKRFRPGQKTAITTLLADRDALVVMPTGGGKSLVYQLAALCQPGVTLVLSPLIALRVGGCGFKPIVGRRRRLRWEPARKSLDFRGRAGKLGIVPFGWLSGVCRTLGDCR